MNNKELIGQVNDLMKRSYWNARYTSELRRLHNVATAKQKPGLRKIISEAIAAKTVNPAHAGSYKRFFSRGTFKPYALFFQALFTPHMERELTEVLRLMLFSESSMSTGSRKAIELAMKAYPKAIGCNEAEAVQALKAAVTVIELHSLDASSESELEALRNAFEYRPRLYQPLSQNPKLNQRNPLTIPL